MIFHDTMDPDTRAETVKLADLTPRAMKLAIRTAELDGDPGRIMALLRAEELQDIEAEEFRVFGHDPVDDEESDRGADRYEQEIWER